MAGCLRLRARTALTFILFALPTALARAQQQPPAEASTNRQEEVLEPPTPFKLHVYANLVQVPTLVLSSQEKLLPPIARDHFDISLDSGRLFHPTQMRMQGNDAIALGILFDAGGDQSRLLAAAAKALPIFVEKQLHSGDSVTLYAVDCKILRSLKNSPPDPVLVKAGVERLLAAPGLHGDKAKPSCGNALHLWDAVVYAANAIGELPGRRVLLVISAGNEAKSTVRLQSASEFLTNRGIALFGMRDPDEMPMNMGLLTSSTRGRGMGSMEIHSPHRARIRSSCYALRMAESS